MDSARWKRIEQLYHAALLRPPRERTAFLDRACAADDDLRRQVDALLAQPSEGQFESPAIVAAAALVTGDAASTLTGRRIGSYQVDIRIGAGAMGEVYRARDTHLGRDVALKVLPDAVSADPTRVARFEREARLLAALNHPRIATIHGFEEVDGVRALVLELVEGPTLAERIGRSPLPITQAITLGLQIAEALEAAHDKGIIHRDLKPANIKVLPNGAVKVLDFGLAKALAGDESRSDVSHLPTVTATHVTGLVMGTPAYMSPEQARGDQVDRQTDIWAFGCVLYEMLTGRMVFVGKTLSDTLAAILEHEPDWRALPPSTPAKLRDLLRRCLQKDPKRRLRDVGDAVNELVDLLNPPSSDMAIATPVADSRHRTATLVVGASILSAVITAAALWALRPQSATAPVRSVRFTVGTDGPDALEPSGLDRDLALSPDGRRLVYVAGGPGRVRLVSRALGELDATRLWDLETPRAPFFSPDGRRLGFFGLFGNLKRVSIDGGPASEISRGVGGASRGASWGPDGSIIFATTDPTAGLLRVSEAGGEAEVLTKPDTAHGELDHFWPEILPGGRAVLFTIMSPGPIDTAQVALLNLETRATKILLRGGTAAQYVPTGHLLYGAGGGLHAVPFDLDRLELTGDPIKVLDRVAITADGAVNAAVSKDGTLAYVRPRSAGAMRTLVWVNRDGRETAINAPPRPYTYPRLSPDGTRVALEVWDENRDIWVWDLARETLTRLTDTPGRDGFPVWTSDSTRLIFGSARGGATNLYWRAAAGTGQVERLTESPQIQFPYSVSPSGANVLIREEHADTALDISVVSLNGDRRATTLLRTKFNELNAEVSPDGRWFAYQSNESGQDEIYVRPFPEIGDERQQVSTNGGTRPVWARNGRELFYMAPDGLFGVTIAPGPGFKLGSPLRLINRRYFAETAFIGRTYDVSPDGQRFLMIKDDAGDGVRPAIVVVQNWVDQLKALVSPR